MLDIIKGYIHSFESMGAVDGPGLRFVIFMQGCPLRCLYCHNPDSWELKRGKIVSSSECVSEIIKYKSYFGSTGGVTVSGGEPLLQIDFLIDLFKKLKELNIHTCIDTSGVMFSREKANLLKFKELLSYTDLVLLDLKHINEEEHIKLTTRSNKNILDFFKFLDEIKKPVWVRYVLVPDINTQLETLEETRRFLDGLTNVEKVEVLPYHTLGVKKYEELGIPYKLAGTPTPTDSQIKLAEKILCKRK